MTASTSHRHSLRTLSADYSRAAGGMLLTLLPLAIVETTQTVAWILAIGGALFAVYGCLSLLRHLTHVQCDDTGIGVSGPVNRRIDWAVLESLRLRYYATRRDGRNGWFQLVVKGPSGAIRIESTLPGFADIVGTAVQAANKKGIDLSATTRRNIEVLGVETGLFTSNYGSPCRIS